MQSGFAAQARPFGPGPGARPVRVIVLGEAHVA